MTEIDPHRTNPDRYFDPKFIELVGNARKEYGKLWMYDELIATCEFLNEQFPNKGNNFLEIGSAQGGSFHCFSTFFSGKKISIDFPFNKGETSIGLENCKLRHAHWEQHFDKVTSIIGKSNESKVIDELKTVLNGEKLDWLFIDGDHEYSSVIHDFNTYKEFVGGGGAL